MSTIKNLLPQNDLYDNDGLSLSDAIIDITYSVLKYGDRYDPIALNAGKEMTLRANAYKVICAIRDVHNNPGINPFGLLDNILDNNDNYDAFTVTIPEDQPRMTIIRVYLLILKASGSSRIAARMTRILIG